MENQGTQDGGSLPFFCGAECSYRCLEYKILSVEFYQETSFNWIFCRFFAVSFSVDGACRRIDGTVLRFFYDGGTGKGWSPDKNPGWDFRAACDYERSLSCK